MFSVWAQEHQSKDLSLCLCPSVGLCIWPSFPPDSQIMWSRVTAVLHKPPPPLHVLLPPCVGFVRWGDGQLSGTAGHSLGGPDLPPWHASLPASTLFTQCKRGESPFPWLLLYVLSDTEARAGMNLNKSRNNQDASLPKLHRQRASERKWFLT